MVKVMNKKTIWGSVLGISVAIVGGLLLNNSVSNKTIETVAKATVEAEKHFGGVPLSKLNEIAKSIDPRDYCTIDEYGFLMHHYKSNRGHQNFSTQMVLDEAFKLKDLFAGNTFPGQRWSHASEFVKRVNDSIVFNSTK